MENINIGITDNDGRGEKLRVAFEIVNENFQELVPQFQELIFYHTFSIETLEIGTPLIIGDWYFVKNVEIDDDFSNVGYIQGQYFKATRPYPTRWNISEVKKITLNIVEKRNTFEGIIFEPYITENSWNNEPSIKISDSVGFQSNNTYVDLGEINNDSVFVNLDFTGAIYNIKRY